MPARATSGTPQSQLVWQSLRVLQIYRLTLSILLFVLFISETGPKLLGSADTQLYALTSTLYFLFMLAVTPVIFLSRRLNALWLHVPTVVDLAAITLIMHASGGVNSGLGMLLLISVAGASLLLPERYALLYAAAASLSVLGEEVVSNLLISDHNSSYTQAGILGTALFAIAVLAAFLGTRASASEALATRRGIDLANLEKINAYVIRHMQSGVLVLDNNGNIRHANQSARRLLNLRELEPGVHPRAPRALLSSLAAWRTRPAEPSTAFRMAGSNIEILPRYTLIGQREHDGVLAFLEDSTWVTQRAQEIKLATLGRLTATIAHEIRNPLAAISHSGQLLGESEQLDKSDQRLAEIIRNHARRLNTIVENVLQISRRDRSRPRQITLLPWLNDFIAEFTGTGDDSQWQVQVDVSPADLQVRIDPTHLHQVLYNLVTNAIQHAADTAGQVTIRLHAHHPEGTHQACLDITDSGPGIDEAVSGEMFEPFFTTATQGTGLGLFIARELCELNHGTLEYVHDQDRGRFRIRFAADDQLEIAI